MASSGGRSAAGSRYAPRRRQGARLYVRDNGPGPAANGDGVTGLSNLRQRLLTLYGNDHRLELRALPGGGAEAMLEVPLVRRAAATAARPA